MFQHSGWMISNLIFWVVLHPLLRIVVYPHWELKPFIHSMEFMSAGLLILQVLSLWTLYGWPRERWEARPWVSALALFPVVWLFNSLILWLFMEFRLVQEPLLEPLYDSQHFIRQHPISWTSLGFILSAIWEEIFFRAWMPDFLQKRLRRSAALVLSALLFAVAHISLHTTVQALLAYFLFALSLSYVRSFHGLGAAIGIHLLNNVLAFGSQAFHFNFFAELQAQKSLLYLMLLFLSTGLLLVGRDVLRLVDKGAEAP